MKLSPFRSALAASFLLLAGLAAHAQDMLGPGWQTSGPVAPIPVVDAGSPVAPQGMLGPGWQTSGPVAPLPVLDASAPSVAAPAGLSVQSSSLGSVTTQALVAGPSPTAVTPELKALATGLNKDPVRIFNYVRNKVEYQPYWGSQKGAHTTYLDGAGNDMDQCSLLIALLNEAGYTNCTYVYGKLTVPLVASDSNDLAHWVGNASGLVAVYSLAYGGVPNIGIVSQGAVFDHIWVRAVINGTTYDLDPSYKISDLYAGADFKASSGYSRSDLLTAAGGTATADYALNLSRSGVENKLRDYAGNLRSAFRTNYPNHESVLLLGGKLIYEQPVGALAQGAPLAAFSPTSSGTAPYVTFATIGSAYQATFRVQIGTQIDSKFTLDSLQAQRLSLTFSGGNAQLWLGDTQVGPTESNGSGTTASVILSVTHPGDDPVTGTIVVNQTLNAVPYPRTGSYDLSYAVHPNAKSNGQIDASNRRLQTYLASGLTDTSRQVLTETLHGLGIKWVRRVALVNNLVTSLLGEGEFIHHVIGRTGQESAYYVDMPGVIISNFDGAGTLPVGSFNAASFLFSAMEHGVIEQAGNSPGANASLSTVKCLALANDGGQKIFKATAANYATGVNVQSQLTNYTTTEKNNFASLTTGGHSVLLHQNGQTTLNQWKGSGYADFSGGYASMIINGLYSGGFNSTFGSSLGSYSIQTTNDSSISLFSPPNLPSLTGADPVDLLTGAFTMQHDDLAVGLSGSPRGLAFSRYYDGTRNFQSTSLGNGWRHSCEGKVTLSSELDAAFGFQLATDAAQTIVGILAVNDFSDTSYSPRELLVGALAANWTVNRITNNSANVQIGDKRVSYTSLPDGSWNPPAGSTAALTGASGSFVLSPRFGGSVTFDSLNRLSTWKDVDNNTQTFTYDGTSGKLTTVTDSFSRTLTFTYGSSGAANGLLTGVADSAGRSVSFGYTAGTTGSANLTGVTDPESYATTLVYDSRNRLTDWKDNENATVSHNDYDALDRVSQQLSQGISTHKWTFQYSPGQTLETDPLTGVTTHWFDFKNRHWATFDPLGNVPYVEYDGQNHVVVSVDATSRTSTLVYDGNQNLVQSIDPAGKTTVNQYDTGMNLWKTTDPTSRTTTYLYDANHHPTSVTDPGGRTTTTAYRSDGLVQSVTNNDGKTTAFTAYDKGMPTGITRADTTTVSATYNTRGDLLTQTDGRGQTTTFTYDRRRLPVTATDAYGHVATAAFDSNGNPSSATDRNGKTTAMVFNNLGHPVSATAPDTAAVTTAYNLADWPVSMTDGLGHATTSGYDAAGRKISTTNALGTVIAQTAYDGAGRVQKQRDGLNHDTWSFYDTAGRLSTTLDPLSHRVDQTYDDAGRSLTLKNRRGKTFTFGYATDGLSASQTYPTGRVSQIVARDPVGRPKTLLSPAGNQTALTYDAMGRVKTQSDTVISTLTWTYDNEGNATDLAEAPVGGGATTHIGRVFDALGRVTSVTDSQSNAVGYTYDNEGNVKTIVYPGNKTVTYTYDGSNRLKTVVDWAGRTTTYTYDAGGRIQEMDRANSTRQRVFFDNANRLSGTTEEKMSGTNIVATLWQAGYAFDNANRLTTFSPTPAGKTYAPPSATLTYDDDNQVATYNGQAITHDLDGNLGSSPVYGTLLGALTWDKRNRLLSSGGVSYTYDAENRRRTSTITATGAVTRYVWSRGARLDRLLATVNPDGSTTRYIYGSGLLYEETTSAGGVAQSPVYYHFDWRGDTVAMSDSTGAVVARLSYSPFGERTVESGTVTTPFCFNGKWGVMTEATGLLAMQARYYSPVLRRFLNEDPSGFSGGMNLYAFAGGDPIDLMDPFGLGPVGSGSSYNYTSVVGTGMGSSWTLQDQAFSNSMGYAPEDLNGAYYGQLSQLAAAAGDSALERSANLGLLGAVNADPSTLARNLVVGLGSGAAPALERSLTQSAVAFNPANFADDVASIRAQSLINYGQGDGITAMAVQPSMVDISTVRFPVTRPFADPVKLARQGPFNMSLYTPAWAVEKGGVITLQNGVTRIQNARKSGITQLPIMIFKE